MESKHDELRKGQVLYSKVIQNNNLQCTYDRIYDYRKTLNEIVDKHHESYLLASSGENSPPEAAVRI